MHIELPQHGYFFYDNNFLPKEQFDEMVNRRSNIPTADMIRMKNQFDVNIEGITIRSLDMIKVFLLVLN